MVFLLFLNFSCLHLGCEQIKAKYIQTNLKPLIIKTSAIFLCTCIKIDEIRFILYVLNVVFNTFLKNSSKIIIDVESGHRTK